jgi:hypothetical protein
MKKVFRTSHDSALLIKQPTRYRRKEHKMKKFLAILLTTLVTTNVCACNYTLEKEREGSTKQESVGIIEKTDNGCYVTILKLYKELLTNNNMDTETLTKRSEQEFFTDIYSVSVNIDSKKAGYALKDLNNDHVDELLLLDEDGVLFAIFTTKSGKAIAVDYFSVNNNRGAIDANGIIYKETLSKGNSWRLKITRIMENGNLDRLEYGVYDPEPGMITPVAFLYRNGMKEFVDEATVNALYEQHSQHISYQTPPKAIADLGLIFTYVE